MDVRIQTFLCQCVSHSLQYTHACAYTDIPLLVCLAFIATYTRMYICRHVCQFVSRSSLHTHACRYKDISLLACITYTCAATYTCMYRIQTFLYQLVSHTQLHTHACPCRLPYRHFSINVSHIYRCIYPCMSMQLVCKHYRHVSINLSHIHSYIHMHSPCRLPYRHFSISLSHTHSYIQMHVQHTDISLLVCLIFITTHTHAKFLVVFADAVGCFTWCKPVV